ncbi:MAG TPA: hypothetical protein VNI01_07755 [Elusimicrobiota bacterium]|jgi:hypothetical protein|nr:hypothetical protein [Elusimicrobiota bacterium]
MKALPAFLLAAGLALNVRAAAASPEREELILEQKQLVDELSEAATAPGARMPAIEEVLGRHSGLYAQADRMSKPVRAAYEAVILAAAGGDPAEVGAEVGAMAEALKPDIEWLDGRAETAAAMESGDELHDALAAAAGPAGPWQAPAALAILAIVGIGALFGSKLGRRHRRWTLSTAGGML